MSSSCPPPQPMNLPSAEAFPAVVQGRGGSGERSERHLREKMRESKVKRLTNSCIFVNIRSKDIVQTLLVVGKGKDGR